MRIPKLIIAFTITLATSPLYRELPVVLKLFQQKINSDGVSELLLVREYNIALIAREFRS